MESRQAFVNQLATENGLARIRQLVEADFSTSYSVLKPMFDPHCILFLRIISHDDVRRSLVLERAVGTIYNVVYRHDGNRGIQFFRKTATCLEEMTIEIEGVDEKVTSSQEEALLLTTKALLTTLTLNQGAAIKTEFIGIVEQLCSCYHTEDVNRNHANSEVRFVHDNILKIKDILSMGKTLSASKSATTRTTTASQRRQPGRHLTELEIDLPSELSKHGPRHDNDCALISNIKILPTLSEILND